MPMSKPMRMAKRYLDTNAVENRAANLSFLYIKANLHEQVISYRNNCKQNGDDDGRSEDQLFDSSLGVKGSRTEGPTEADAFGLDED